MPRKPSNNQVTDAQWDEMRAVFNDTKIKKALKRHHKSDVWKARALIMGVRCANFDFLNDYARRNPKWYKKAKKAMTAKKTMKAMKNK